MRRVPALDMRGEKRLTDPRVATVGTVGHLVLIPLMPPQRLACVVATDEPSRVPVAAITDWPYVARVGVRDHGHYRSQFPLRVEVGMVGIRMSESAHRPFKTPLFLEIVGVPGRVLVSLDDPPLRLHLG
jgi:hypothetical protein